MGNAGLSHMFVVAGLVLLLGPIAVAQEKDSTGSGGENASNPLASVAEMPVEQLPAKSGAAKAIHAGR